MKSQGLISFLVYVVVAALAWFAVVPQVGEVLSANRALSDLAGAMSKASILKANIEKLYGGYESELIKANDYLMAVPPIERLNQADLLTEIQSMASLAGVVVDSADVDTSYDSRRQARGTNSGLVSVPIKVSLTGSYQGLKQFILLAEKNLPLFDGNSLSIAAGVDSESYKLQVSFNAFGIK